MGSFLDTALVVVILLFLGMIIWSRIMNQTMFDTAMEIKSIVVGLFKGEDE